MLAPLRKHNESQESDGQTGSCCLDQAVTTAHDARYQKIQTKTTKERMARKPAHTSP